MEDWNFYGKIEGSYYADLSIGKSVAVRDLSLEVSSDWESSGDESRIVSAEILEEFSSDVDFALNLSPWLWQYIMDWLYEKVVDFLMVEKLDHFGADVSPLMVSLGVLEGTMKSALFGCQNWLSDFSYFEVILQDWMGNQRVSIKRVRDGCMLLGLDPVALDEMVQFEGGFLLDAVN